MAGHRFPRRGDPGRFTAETGRYGPGYRLVFTVLARDLGVSVQPVREATRRLGTEGWVAVKLGVDRLRGDE